MGAFVAPPVKIFAGAVPLTRIRRMTPRRGAKLSAGYRVALSHPPLPDRAAPAFFLVRGLAVAFIVTRAQCRAIIVETLNRQAMFNELRDTCESLRRGGVE